MHPHYQMLQTIQHTIPRCREHPSRACRAKGPGCCRTCKADPHNPGRRGMVELASVRMFATPVGDRVPAHVYEEAVVAEVRAGKWD